MITYRFYFLNFLLLVFCGLYFSESAAQDHPPLVIDGQILDGRDRLEGAFVRIEKNGNFDREIRTDRRGKFDFELELFNEFTIYFGKEGFVTKKIYVDTRTISEGQIKSSYLRYGGWKVEIFPDDLGVDIAILDKPIGKVTYSDEYNSFINDDFYTKTIQNRLDKLVEDLRRARDEQIMAQERMEEEYELALEDAEAFMKEGDLENALFQYRAAMKLKPKEKFPQKQIEKLNEQINENRDLEERYNSLLTQADDLFYENKWKEAVDLYKDASTIKPNEFYPKDQIEKCEENIEGELRRARLKEEYDKQLAKADHAFEGDAIAEAKELYKSVLNILPEEDYPQKQIALIDERLAEEAEKQERFDEKMEQGIAAMGSEDFETARGFFTEAMKIKPKDKAPKEKIAEIELILRDRAEEIERQKELEERRRAAYNKLIAKADSAFDKNEIDEAEKIYKNALKMFEESHPKEQLEAISAIRNKKKEEEKEYNRLVAAGNKLLISKEYEPAKEKFTAALELKPGEELPKNKIEEIDRILRKIAQKTKKEEWAAEQELKRKTAEYDSLITLADGALGSDQYKEAQNLYRQADGIFEEKDYPRKKIEEIDSLLADIEKRNRDYAKFIEIADKYYKKEEWQEAVVKYQEALSLKSEESYPKDRILEIGEIIKKENAAEQERRMAEKEKLEAERAKYDAKIAEADALFQDSAFAKSIKVYEESQKIMPEEEYPGIQIENARDMIAALEQQEKERLRLAALASEKEEQYENLLTEAGDKIKEERFEEAILKLDRAVELIPSREKAKEEKKRAEDLLAAKKERKAEQLKAEAEAEEQLREYNSAMQLASNNLEKEKFNEAIAHYKYAAQILPEEKEPKRKIQEIEDLIAERKKEEEERLERERLQKQMDEQYAEYIAEADSLMSAENFSRARTFYERAIGVKGDEPYPQEQIKKIYKLREAERERLAKFNSDLSRFNYELAEKYPEGKTENVEEKGNRTVTTIVIVKGEVGHEFVKEEYSWGDVYYRKNRRPYVKQNWEREVREFQAD